MIIVWPVVQAFLRANWKPIAFAAAILALYGWHKWEVSRAWHAGRVALVAEQAEEARKRDSDAQKADDAVRSCAADPACLLRKDPYRRD